MNVKERVEWTKALRSCFPGLQTDAMAAATEIIDAPGRWEVSVRGGALTSAGLRFFGDGDYAAWRKTASKAFVLGNSGPTAPRAGFPWLTATWDLQTGLWTSVRLCGEEAGRKLRNGQALAWDFSQSAKIPKTKMLSPVPFKAGAFGEPALNEMQQPHLALAPADQPAARRPRRVSPCVCKDRSPRAFRGR